MGNTFLLKNALGQIAGFLVQNEKEIQYKIDQKAGDEVEVVLRFDDDSLENKRVILDGKEHIFPGGIKKIKGIVVIAANEDVVLCAGDDFYESVKKNKTQARVIAEANESEIRSKEQMCGNETGHDMKQIMQEKAKMASQNRWPQHRWPPPPCMRYAVYYNGKWKDE